MKYWWLLVGLFVLAGCERNHDPQAFSPLPGFQLVTAPAEPSSEDPRAQSAYLLMGQSNMGNRCVNSAPNFIGEPGCSTGQQIAEVMNDQSAVYIQCAVGGTEMSRWIPGGDLYERCLCQIPAGVQIIGAFFFQGESDAINGLSVPDWSDAFISMVDDLRARVGPIAVVYAQIGAGRSDDDWNALKADQASVQGSRLSMVRTDDLQPVEGVHFDQASYRVIAERMVSEFNAIKG